MFHSLKILIVASVILGVAFVIAACTRYFVASLVVGIFALFILIAVCLSRIIKEMQDEKIAVAEEIKELKKKIKELEK